MNDFHQLKNDLVTITTEVIDAAHLTQNDLFVLGCSTRMRTLEPCISCRA